MRGVSQNARFIGPARDAAHPIGEPLATLIHEELRQRGVDVSPPDNWRDSGWSIACRVADTRLEVVLAATDEDWYLQVAPLDPPGLIRSLMTSRVCASAPACLALARQVHAVLSAYGCRQHWCWDGPPADADPSEPSPLDDAPA